MGDGQFFVREDVSSYVRGSAGSVRGRFSRRSRCSRTESRPTGYYKVLQGNEQFPGPELRIPAPRMPYYPHPHRVLLPTPSTRASWHPPFYRTHSPRRRHHLDDIFLPNHDDDEYSEHDEGFHPRSSGSRPSIRVEVKTTKGETITKEIRAVNVPSEKVTGPKSLERTLIDNTGKIKDNSEFSQSSPNTVSSVKDSTKSVANTSADKAVSLSKSEVQTENQKQNETKPSTAKFISIQTNSEASSKQKEIRTTSVQNKKTSKNDSFQGEYSSEQATGSQNHKIDGASKDKNATNRNENLNEVLRLATIVNSDSRKNENEKLLKKQYTNLTKTIVPTVDRSISKHTSDISRSKNESTSTKKISNLSANLDGQVDKKSHVPKDNITPEGKTNFDDKNVKIKSCKNDIENKDKEKLQRKECAPDSKNTEKGGQQKSDKNSNQKVRNERSEKPEQEHEKSIEKPECYQQIIQGNVIVKDNVNSNKESNNPLNMTDKKSGNSTPPISAIEKNSSDSVSDIVKELEALVSQRDDHMVSLTKSLDKSDEQKSGDEGDRFSLNSDKQITLEEGNLTQDTTPTSAPSSPQAIKKDIRIKLIRLPLPRSPLATESNKNCANDSEISKFHIRSDKNSSSGSAKSDYVKAVERLGTKLFDKLSTISIDKFAKTDTLQIPNSSSSADKTDTDNNDNSSKDVAILEDIFILEDALKNIDNPSEIIEVPSSPPAVGDDTGPSAKDILDDGKRIVICSTPKRGSKPRFDGEKSDSQDVQIIDDQHETIEIVDDDNGNLSVTLKDKPVNALVPIEIIKIESPDDRENLKSPTNLEFEDVLGHQRSLGDFGSLDTRASFLWTFHQRFDDPRIVDMDISHSPSPSAPLEEPVRTEQQVVTDRIIKDMNELWKEISNNENEESNTSSEITKHVDLKRNAKCNKVSDEELNSTSDIVGTEVDKLSFENVTNCKQSEESTSIALETEEQSLPTEKTSDEPETEFDIIEEKTKKVLSFSANINSVLKFGTRLTVNGRESAKIGRSVSFSYITNNLETSLRLTKSLNDLASINKVDFCFSGHVPGYNLEHIRVNEICTQTRENCVSKANTQMENSNVSKFIEYKDEVLLLSSSEYQDKTSNNIIKSPHKESKSSSSENLDSFPTTVCDQLISTGKAATADNKTTNDIKEMKRKRVRRIESSDEESLEEMASSIPRENGEDWPKRKKQKVIENPNRKRKHPLDDNQAIKTVRKDNEGSKISSVHEESRRESLAINKSSLPAKTDYQSGSEVVTSGPVQTPTKYVTKAEYIKSFAKKKSPVPHISLSIEPIPKARSVKHRRATFTCEADNETILKKVDSGERCKQKFLDLFGSISDDEEDLIQVSRVEVCKISLDGDREVGRKEFTQEGIGGSDAVSLKKFKTDEQRKRTLIFNTGVEENRISSESSETSNIKSKKYKMSYYKVGDDRKDRDGVRISKETDASLIKNPERDGTSGSLNRQKSNELHRERNVGKEHKDSRIKNINLTNRRDSSSSTDSKSRDSSRSKKAERASRSHSKESDTSVCSDVEKNIINSNQNYKKKEEKDEKERKSEKTTFKGYVQSEGSYLNMRRVSASSNESSNSGHNRHKQKIDEENYHRKLLLKERNSCSENDENTSVSVNNLHKSNQKPGVSGSNKKDVEQVIKKTSSQNKSLVTETSNLLTKGRKTYRRNKGTASLDAFSKKILDNRKFAVEALQSSAKYTNCTADRIKKLKDSCRRNSAPDILNSSSETSLIIDELADFPLLYRSSEGEINEIFQNCRAFRPQCIKFDKITRITTVDVECVDKVYIIEPPQTRNDSRTIKEDDDDIIEIRQVVPMIDLTEEDPRKSGESNPVDTLGELLLEAKEDIAELARDNATITLYRAEVDDINQDEEVRAIAASIPSVLTDRSSIIKTFKDLPQDTTVTSPSGACGQVSSSKNIILHDGGEKTDLEGNKKHKTPNNTKEPFETVSCAASELFSNLVQNLDINVTSQEDITNSKNKAEVITTLQQPVIRGVPTSLEEENQRAVLSVWEHSASSNVEPRNQEATSLQPIIDPTASHSSSISSNVEFQTVNQLVQPTIRNNLQEAGNVNQNQGQVIFAARGSLVHQTTESSNPTEIMINSASQTSSPAVDYQTTGNEPHESYKSPVSDITDRNKRPRIIVRPTRAEQNSNAFKGQNDLTTRLAEVQNKFVQGPVGQHRGLPQTLREYRPVRRVSAVIPPALVNINHTQESPQESRQTCPGKEGTYSNENNIIGTSSQNLSTINSQNVSTENTQISVQNSRVTENQSNGIRKHSVIDLTEDNAELSTVDMRIIVDIFTRHVYFLAHLCKAQNEYMEYLRRQPFCQNYFKAEIGLFEEQKQARLISQSLRLCTELLNLDIRVTRNLSGSASAIVEQIAVNLLNRDMPKQVTRSMVYLLIAQLIKPQSELFSRVPLLQALIRLCNIVLGRLYSKYPGPLTEAQRKILTQQVEQYNRMFGRTPSSQNNLNSEITQSRNSIVQTIPNDPPILGNNHPIPNSGHTVLGNEPNGQIDQAALDFRQQIPVVNQPAANLQQPPVQPSESTPLTKLSRFGLPQPVMTTGGNSVTYSSHLSRGPPNVTLVPNSRMQGENSPNLRQISTGSNPMKPPSYKVPKSRQPRLANTRQPGAFVVPNNSHQTRPIRDLPGGANTNTLGRTPRYIANYDMPSQSYVYGAAGRPRQQSSLPSSYPPLRNNLPSQRINAQSLQNQTVNTRSVLINQSNLNNNSMLSRLLNDRSSSIQTSSAVQQSPKPTGVASSPWYELNLLHSSQNNTVPENRPVTQSPMHNVIFQSPRHIVVSQSPLYNGGSVRQPPSYEEATATNPTYPSNGPSPNQLSTEAAKKRNEDLLNELLSTSDNVPVFGRPSSPPNDNFRIKLPFTKPDQTTFPTIRTTSADTSSALTDKETNASLSIQTVASNTEVPKISSPRTQTQTSEPVAVSQTLVHFSSETATSQAAVVLVNNTAASTKYVVGHPERNVVLNQGLAALSSIGQASAMLNSSSQSQHQTQSSQPIISVQKSLQSQPLPISNQPPPCVSGASQTVSPVLTMSQSQNQNSMTFTEVDASSQNPTSIVTSPNFNVSQRQSINSSLRSAVTTTDKEKMSAQCARFKFKVVSKRVPKETNTKVAKPKCKPKPKNRGRPAKHKKGTVSKQIEIVDLLSSDEDMLPEIQSDNERLTSEETESDKIKRAEAEFQVEVSEVNAENIGQRAHNYETLDLPESCASKTPTKVTQSSSSDLPSRDPQSSTSDTRSSYLQPSNSQTQIEHSQTCTSKNPKRLENGVEEDIETIDLTWIDDMDDQELQREMDFLFIKKEEPRDEAEQFNERNNLVVPSPADSGICSPPIEGDDDTTVYTVNVQRLCICSQPARYNCVCEEAWYCGQECQLKDWESHQKVCQIAREAMGSEEELVLNEQEVDLPDGT